MTTTTVAISGYSSEVTSDVGYVHDWLSEYLLPWWHDNPPGTTIARVFATTDPDAVRAAWGSIGRRSAQISGFYGHPTVRERSDNLLTVATDRTVVRRSPGDCPSVEVTGTSDSDTAHTVALLVRQLTQVALQRDGWLLVHAGCAESDDEGSLVVGPKGSGKTATVLNLALHAGQSVVANDRCFLRGGPQGVLAIGWPRPVTIGLGLLGALGWGSFVSSSLRDGELQHHTLPKPVVDALLAGVYRRVVGREGKELKYELLPRHLASVAGISISPGATVRRVLAPTLGAHFALAVRQGGWRIGYDEVFPPFDAQYPNLLEWDLAGVDPRGSDRESIYAAVTSLPFSSVSLSRVVSENAALAEL